MPPGVLLSVTLNTWTGLGATSMIKCVLETTANVMNRRRSIMSQRGTLRKGQALHWEERGIVKLGICGCNVLHLMDAAPQCLSLICFIAVKLQLTVELKASKVNPGLTI